MVTHQQLDARSLALHRLVAQKIRSSPDLFERARATLARHRRIVCANSQPYLLAWERIFDQGMEAALTFATEDSEWATAMRQSSPFAGILTDEERFTFFRNWWREHHDPEKREAREQAALKAWEEYQRTGEHLTGEEVDAWLAKLEAGEDQEPPTRHK